MSRMPPQLHSSCARAEEERIVRLASRCASIRCLDQLHAHTILLGFANNSFIAAKLVRAFAGLGHLHHARAIARSLRDANAFVWTALIRAHSQSGNGRGVFHHAVSLFSQMHKNCPGVRPLTFTLSAALKAAGHVAMLKEGTQIHVHVFKNGFQTDARVATTLVDFYAKCGELDDARMVFEKVVRSRVNDVQLWNTMIAGFMAAGETERAELLFRKMPERNTFTFVEMIGGYAASGKMELARPVFELAVANGEADVVLCTAMISGYAKVGNVDDARLVFNGMRERDVASWNAMIGTYSIAGLCSEALDLFKVMLKSDGRLTVEPNHATISTVASACAQCGVPNLANWIQGYVNHHQMKFLNNHTVAALIDMHSKCGDVERAYGLFRQWKHRDLVCYSSMIAGFGMHGRGKEAIGVFNELKGTGLEPDAICFVSVLTACSHTGMVDEGRQYFQVMKDEYRIAPIADHYMCMVDLLGRAGCIDEAYQLIIHEMPPRVKPHAGIWGALLSACRTYSNVEVGEMAARHLMELEPENAGNYVLLSNIYAKAQRWDGVRWVQALMRSRGMRKPPGWSQIDVEGGLTKFIAGDLHDAALEMVLELLYWELKDHGYSPTILEVG